MKIRHKDLRIDEKDPFLTCKLGRRKDAEILTTVVNTYADGFVLAINNEWGAGKTTFVKMWQQHLRNDGFTSVYFNAWENDFDTNPIVAILAELKSLTKTSNETAFNSALEKGAVLSKNILPAVVKAVTKRYFDSDEVVSAFENATKATAEILQAEIDDYVKKKASINDFRDKLEAFVEKTNNEKPIIFIVDELDRCRPDYAVEVLEQMKHFFSVPGIVFVLSVDKQHLAASIRGFYGSEQIKTDEYLRRFIDLEYSIPEPSHSQFCKYLYEYYAFDDFFKSNLRVNLGGFGPETADFLSMANLLFQAANSTLRQMEKIFGQTRLILNSFHFDNYTLIDALFVLSYLAVMKPDIYSKLKRGDLTLQGLSDLYFSLIPAKKHHERALPIFTEARLLILYANEHDRVKDLAKTDSNGTYITEITSKLSDSETGRTLGAAMENIFRHTHTGNIQMSFLTKKIDLTEELIFQ